jgi:(4S)-4-hydroxy-5-phosphonooxypentane-2,3-dione isomerase
MQFKKSIWTITDIISEDLTLLKKTDIMILTCVYVHVKPEAINDFIEASVLNHKGSVKEPGNLRFDIVQQADDPCRFMLYEAFESEEAAAAHKSAMHYLKWRDTVKDMMAEPRYGVRYNILEPKERSKW